MTQLQAVKDSYVPVIKFQVICLDAASPALLRLQAFAAASAHMTFCTRDMQNTMPDVMIRSITCECVAAASWHIH